MCVCACLRNSSALGLSAPPLTALITPDPVRHSRIPDLPLDSNLLFEALLFLYLLVALFVQYINIYRTVWWSSYSQPSASSSLVHTHTVQLMQGQWCLASVGWRGLAECSRCSLSSIISRYSAGVDDALCEKLNEVKSVFNLRF